MDRADLRAALSHPNVAAFLRVIRQGESRQDDSAYTIMFGGQHFDAPPWNHPGRINVVGSLRSSAAGAYQFLKGTWDVVEAGYGFPDFSPACQDEAAVALIHGRKALEDVKAGRFEDAVRKCAKEWASLPFSPYGQPTLTLELAREVYQAWGGRFAPPPAAENDPYAFNPDSLDTEHYESPVKETPMAPIILPLLQVAATLIPQLAEKFGSGSEVSNRNIAAARVIGDEIVKATNSPNLQAAVERMQEDPQALKAARAAVSNAWPELFEAGGGGIEGARRAAQSPEFPFWKNAAFWISLILIVMPFMLLVDVFYVHPDTYTENLRTQIVTAVLMVISMVGAFWLGTSFGSQRKTNLLAGRE